MLTLFTIFIAVAGAGFAFWFYNKRQVKNLADQIEDKNAVITAFRNHVEETSTPVTPVVETQPQPQKKNSQQKSKNGGNKNHQNGNKSQGQKVQPSHSGKPNPSQDKKNRPNKPRKPKTQQ